jgi:hypothetical protein
MNFNPDMEWHQYDPCCFFFIYLFFLYYFTARVYYCISSKYNDICRIKSNLRPLESFLLADKGWAAITTAGLF